MILLPQIVVQTVLILKADRLYAEALRVATQRAFPRADIVLAPHATAAAQFLAQNSVELVICGPGASREGDVLEFVLQATEKRGLATRIFFIAADFDCRVFGALRLLKQVAVFDSTHEPPARLHPALKLIAAGHHYWSESLIQFIRHRPPSDVFAHCLTILEQLVLSMVGDGSDDSAAAIELGISPATVSTVRRDLHRKLGVQHRGELVRCAAQHGFVRFTPGGVIRPGFASALAAYRARRPARPANGASRSPRPAPKQSSAPQEVPIRMAVA